MLPTDESGRYVRSLCLAGSQEDVFKRPGFLVIGMNFGEVHPCDSDTIRMNALQTMYPLTRVWGVSVHKREDTPTWKHGDVRSPRFWESVTLSQNTKLLVVDYRWCPSTYWEPSSTGLGYGDKWFSSHIPSFFKGGGQVCFLPNDIHGLVRAMCKKHTQQAKTATLCCELVLASANPLYTATEVAWCQSNGESWAASIPRNRANFSHCESLRYCNKKWPFLVCYNRQFFPNMNSVRSWIRSLKLI